MEGQWVKIYDSAIQFKLHGRRSGGEMPDGIAGIGVVLRIAVGGDGILFEKLLNDYLLKHIEKSIRLLLRGGCFFIFANCIGCQ